MAQTPNRLLRALLLAALGMGAILIELAPLGAAANAWPSPDLLLCVVFYWTARRPGSSPFWLIFALGLVRDFLSGGPIGLGALSMLALSEVMRAQGAAILRLPMAFELAALAAAALAAPLAVWLALTVTFAHPPGLIDVALRAALTIAAYPLAALIFRWLLRISARKLTPQAYGSAPFGGE